MHYFRLNHTFVAYVAFFALGIIWGSTFIFTKVASEKLNAQEIVWIRLLFGFIPLFIIAVLTKQLRFSHIKYGHHFLVMGVIATALYYLAYAKGTLLLPSGIAGALSGSITVFAAVSAWCFGPGARITKKSLLGILLGLSGIILIAKPWYNLAELNATHTFNPIGILLMLIGSLSLGMSFSYAKNFLTILPISNLALATYQVGIALLLVSFLMPFNSISALREDANIALASILGLGIIGTACAYFLYYFIVSRLSAVQSASVTYLPPAVAMGIGVFWVGEQVTLLDIGGLISISLGMYFCTTAKQ